jgi:hypothetical protein
MEYICITCKEKKPEKAFRIGGTSFKGKVWRNKTCQQCKQKARKEKKKNWSEDQLKAYKAQRKASRRNNKLNINPERWIWQSAKRRSTKKGLEFNLDVSDIIIPETCPIYDIKLEFSITGNTKHNSPSIDRVDNNKGYIKGNVRIISYIANSRKGNITLEQAKNLYLYMKKHLKNNAL